LPHPRKGLGLAVATALAVLAPGASSASATVTQSSASMSPTFGFTPVGSPSPSTRHLTATTDGAEGDLVDVVCLRGPTTPQTVASGVSVAADKSIDIDVNETNLNKGGFCRIAVVPAGTTPADYSPFAGPFIGGGQFAISKVNTGPNMGIPYDFYTEQAHRKAYADFHSLGRGGLYDMQLSDPTGVIGPELFYDNAYLDRTLHPDGSGGQRPDGLVDGKPALDTFNAEATHPTLAGLPRMDATHSLDPVTGDVTLTDAENLVACSPSEASCTSLVPTGLRVERSIVNDHDGRVATIIDVIRNVDTVAHDFDFEFEEFEHNSGTDDTNSQNGFRFPGESAYAHHVGGDAITTGFGGISTIGMLFDTTTTPAVTNAVGTLTVSPQPTRALFASPYEFWLGFKGTIPAGGSQTIQQTFAMGETQAEVDAYSAQAEVAQDAQSPPSVAITAPADGTTVAATPVTVSGTASDNKGVTSLQVNGADVALASDGTWSTPLALTEGANTITAVAKDATGNQATATRSITYTKPVPPPPPVPPVAKVTKNGKVKVTRKGNKIVVDTGITVGCPAGASACTAATDAKTLKAVAAKLKKTKLTLAKRTFTIAAGKTQKIVLTLSAKGARALKRNKKLKAVVAVVARVGSAPATTTTRTITIKQPKAKKKH
jgi:hypothetical protein